jgi:SAM-dependent methyltransferase
MGPNRSRARQLAAEYLAKGDPTGWFEQLYREAELGQSVVPWAELQPNPNLIDFWHRHSIRALGRAALKIGCGLGDDAEQLAEWAFETTAFDISASAIRACRRRFPQSHVNYVVADLLNPPSEWTGRFDFVLESYTLQVLPQSVRGQAIQRVAALVAERGFLLLIARAREEHEPIGQMPWPLLRSELESLEQFGFQQLAFEDYFDTESPPVRRFRVLYQKQ